MINYLITIKCVNVYANMLPPTQDHNLHIIKSNQQITNQFNE